MDWGGVQRLQLQMCKEEEHYSGLLVGDVNDVMWFGGLCVFKVFNLHLVFCDILKSSVDLYQS